MTTRKKAALIAAGLLVVFLGVARAAKLSRYRNYMAQHRVHAQPAPAEHQHDAEIVQSMTGEHMHPEAHMRWSTLRPALPADQQRAVQIVETLRGSLDKYKDYHAAIADGYEPFFPNAPQRMVHFTNNWQGFLGAFRFDPAQPTSLLYKKTPGGYELIGAMYTAPRGMAEEKLDARVPLSVARWHQHVNICLPPRGKGSSADWTVFGPAGSIATREECSEAGGRFYPQVFGWMVHVYPFEQTPEKIWTH